MWQNDALAANGCHFLKSFFEELRQRNVFRVGIAYVLLGWVVLQGADFLLDLAGAPEWVIRVFAVAGFVGLPFALFFAWAFELTPEGIKRESEIDRSASAEPLTRHKLNIFIIGALVAVIVLMGVERLYFAGDEYQTGPEGEATTAHSIAVLPFLNMSADAEQQYFSDGITEEIINALVRVPGLNVTARTSVFALKGQQQDIRQTGRDLGVTHVVEGSVRSDGQQLRITAQLIQVEDGFHLWSETFNRQRVNVFAIQEEIANAIAMEFTEQLARENNPTPDGQTAGSPTSPPVSIAAYDDYLRGRAHLRARSENDLIQATALFQSVVDAHPGYAPAWAALAITADVQDEDLEVTKSFALRALELDPDNVDALNALGAAYRDAWHWTEAEDMLTRAMAIDPDSSELLEDIAEFMASTGRVTEQLEVAGRGYAIDPYLDPLAAVYAEALITAGQTGEALDVLGRAVARGGLPWLHQTKLLAYLPMGDIEAMRELISGLELPENRRSSALAALADPTNPLNVEAIQKELGHPEFLEGSVLNDETLGFVLLSYLGENETILNALLSWFSQQGGGSVEYLFMPHMAGVRALPRFQELLELVGLPEYWDEAGWPQFCARTEDGMIRCH
jgi:TolB-like protein